MRNIYEKYHFIYSNYCLCKFLKLLQCYCEMKSERIYPTKPAASYIPRLASFEGERKAAAKEAQKTREYSDSILGLICEKIKIIPADVTTQPRIMYMINYTYYNISDKYLKSVKITVSKIPTVADINKASNPF